MSHGDIVIYYNINIIRMHISVQYFSITVHEFFNRYYSYFLKLLIKFFQHLRFCFITVPGRKISTNEWKYKFQSASVVCYTNSSSIINGSMANEALKEFLWSKEISIIEYCDLIFEMCQCVKLCLCLNGYMTEIIINHEIFPMS